LCRAKEKILSLKAELIWVRCVLARIGLEKAKPLFWKMSSNLEEETQFFTGTKETPDIKSKGGLFQLGENIKKLQPTS